jgi:chemotaxis protein MotB
MNATSGVLPFNSNQTTRSSGENEGSEKDAKKRQIEMTFLNTVASELYRLLNLDKDIAEKPLDVQVTTDGLRITLFDRARQPLFVGNTAEFTEWGAFVMQNLSWTVERHKFQVTIDGHTRANLPMDRPNYSVWELSTDRANAARRSLVHYAVDEGSIERITGYADTRPLDGELPEAESNQRITLSLALASKPRQVDKPAAPVTATPQPTS